MCSYDYPTYAPRPGGLDATARELRAQKAEEDVEWARVTSVAKELLDDTDEKNPIPFGEFIRTMALDYKMDSSLAKRAFGHLRGDRYRYLFGYGVFKVTGNHPIPTPFTI